MKWNFDKVCRAHIQMKDCPFSKEGRRLWGPIYDAGERGDSDGHAGYVHGLSIAEDWEDLGSACFCLLSHILGREWSNSPHEVRKVNHLGS
jgi:hypothetical protein